MKIFLRRIKSQKSQFTRGLILIPALFLAVQIFAQSVVPGNVYLDSTGYVEYTAGNLPFVISVPHGGHLKPSTIPDRNCSGCRTINDSYTQELGREIQAAFFKVTGCYPHLVVNLLHRSKFDANRDIGDAADGNATVEKSWRGYHRFIDSAKVQITNDYGRGLFLDMHGHGHSKQRIELGYLIMGYELRYSDSYLNSNSALNYSSIKSLVNNNIHSYTHAELLRGTSSYGTILNGLGFPAVPSTSDPSPASGDIYFSGGYNTSRHSSADGGVIDGIQMECNHNIRFDSTLRKKFADSLVIAVIRYYNIHYYNNFDGNYCGIIGINNHHQEVDFRIFPNPTNDVLNIESSYNELEIEVFNNLGQKVMSLNWHGETLNVSNLKSGFYFLKLSNKGKPVGNRKFLKM